jgi:hypothetical protein
VLTHRSHVSKLHFHVVLENTSESVRRNTLIDSGASSQVNFDAVLLFDKELTSAERVRIEFTTDLAPLFRLFFFFGVVRNNNNLRIITADQEQSIATLFTLSLKEDWVPVVTDPNIQKREKKRKKDRRTLESEGIWICVVHPKKTMNTKGCRESQLYAKATLSLAARSSFVSSFECLGWLLTSLLVSNHYPTTQGVEEDQTGVTTSRICRRGENLQHTHLVDSAGSLDKLGWLWSACISIL